MDSLRGMLHHGDPVVAVVGATDNPHKYGNQIYRDLKFKGYRVFAVNPFRETIDGDPVYADLADLPVAPDLVSFVVPPARTLRVLERATELGFRSVWIQPGAGDEAVVRYLDEHEFDYLINDCIMVRSRVRSTN